MASTQFRDAIINFGSTVNGTINGTGSVTFPTNVINATAAIKKWNAVYVKEGFVKVIFDAQYDECLGAHMVGAAAGITGSLAKIQQ